MANVLFISQDSWLNGVDIQTAGTIGLGFNSQFWQPSTESLFNYAGFVSYEIALGNVTDWTPYNVSATMNQTAYITFNDQTLKKQFV